MLAARKLPQPIIASVCILFVVAMGCAGCGGTSSAGSAAVTTSLATPSKPTGTMPLTPLSAPKVSAAQDAEFLSDVTEADPALVSYEQSQGDVALRALLTDGSAFCAFLQQGGDLDNAMVDVAVGARGVEAQTHLPESVTTFNAIEAVALLTLCPSYQPRLPAAERSKIRDLGNALAKKSG